MTRIAIVGAGYMAAEHARAFAAIDGVEIVGFCGRTPAKVEALAAEHSAPVYPDIATLHAQTGADGVVVTVNELSMRDVATAAFAHPWQLLLEKPVGLHLAEAREITAAADAAGARAYVALNRRSYASTRAALEKLGRDGPPRLVSVLDQQDMQGAREFGQPEEVVQNYMYANSIHLIDYFAAFCRGEPDVVTAAVNWEPEQPRHVVATLHYSSGDTGVYQAVWDGPGPWSVTVTDAAARYEMRPLESLGVQARGERRVVPVELGTIDTDFKPGLKVQAEEFVKAIRGEGAPALATLGDATRSMELCARIYGFA